MNESTFLKAMQLMSGVQVIQDITENLSEATKKVNDIKKEWNISNIFSINYNEDTLDKELKNINKSLREIVETIVEVLDSCPVVGCEEVTKEEFTKLSAGKSVQEMLDEIGLVINKGDDDEHK